MRACVPLGFEKARPKAVREKAIDREATWKWRQILNGRKDIIRSFTVMESARMKRKHAQWLIENGHVPGFQITDYRNLTQLEQTKQIL
jgi:hypothetical protein